MAPDGNVVLFFFRNQDSLSGFRGGGDPLKIITDRGVSEAISWFLGGSLFHIIGEFPPPLKGC